MTLSRHALVLLTFLLAACAATTPSTPLPEAVAYARPADGFLRVSRMTVDTSQGSVWGWRVRAPEGTWKVVCRYEGWSGGDQFSADVQFPSGAKLTLPADGVSTACSGTSREPELEAWKDDLGRVLLRLHGEITATISEGVFAFDGRRLDGWWCRAVTYYSPDLKEREIHFEGVFDGDGKQIAP